MLFLPAFFSILASPDNELSGSRSGKRFQPGVAPEEKRLLKEKIRNGDEGDGEGAGSINGA